jgi:predicted N-acetyltransferase YhbS
MTYVCMQDFQVAAQPQLVIREESVVDIAARERLLDAAFGPARFAKTCERLREGRAPAAGLALVAALGEELVGTIRFWHVQAGGRAALLLGPLAVDLRFRSLGIGRKLIAEGLFRAVQRGHQGVILVGDASYYNQLGFERMPVQGLAMPGPVEMERFLGLELVPGALRGATGLVCAAGAPLRRSMRKTPAELFSQAA